MKESYVEGLATHNGPVPSAVVRKDGGDVLVGVHAGRVLSRETNLWGAGVLGTCGQQHSSQRHGKLRWDPTRSETPGMHGSTLRENREIPCLPTADGAVGREGKSKDIRRR